MVTFADVVSCTSSLSATDNLCLMEAVGEFAETLDNIEEVVQAKQVVEEVAPGEYLGEGGQEIEE